ncbi:MAG: HD superfamily phosphohydrolase [Arenicella sp.]|jgi:HD superfamily phosphohydrolase
MKSQKVINDPVYGFLTIPSKLIFKIVSHPYFQRLRRIRQLGLTDYVYPGALHTRFHHALGAMHLMSVTLDNLKAKGHKISKKEYESALIAILLHDIGHGPFSHALEYSILRGVDHEQMSLLLMNQLNKEFRGRLDLAIDIFTGKYERKFFHQLVSSQLDMDRLDYLQRDCFFTGVVEGNVGVKRILKMLDIHNDEIVVEEKGIYSIESFLNARRLMYWQVYLHKTTVSTEQMLTKIVQRARWLVERKHEVFASPPLHTLLNNSLTINSFKENPDFLKAFAKLDDFDIWGAIKIWVHHDDKVLSMLSENILNRSLFRTSFYNEPPSEYKIGKVRDTIREKMKLSAEDVEFMYAYGNITNAGYAANSQTINIKTKKGKIIDVAKASDLPNIKALSKIVRKYYLSYPKGLGIK